MADQPTDSSNPQPNTPANPPAPPADSPANAGANPTPANTASPAPEGQAAPATQPSVPAEPLADGTVPTVLQTGSTLIQTKSKSGRAGINSVYRRADITTTLITFVGAVVASGVILGLYTYLTRTQIKPPTATKVQNLDKSELDKLSSFFSGNSAGNPAEVLTVSSSSFFKNRVAFASDVKVIGGLETTGPTALGDLVVDKTSTLGVTNVRGQLNVAGPLTLQSPATITGSTTINSNLTVSGNGSFGGTLSAGLLNIHDLSVSGNLNLAGHLAITGQTPTIAPAAQAGSGAATDIDGNDSAGTVTITTGSVPAGNLATGSGQLITVTFRTPYGKVPHIVITPVGPASGALSWYVIKTATSFTIGTTTDLKSNTVYAFDYWVVQ